MTRMMRAGHSNPGATGAVVTARHHDGRGTALRAEGSAGSMIVTLAATPDLAGARRRLGALRRIDEVELAVGSSGVAARLRGRRNRLPGVGPVSVAVALGLIELGVRGRIVNGA